MYFNKIDAIQSLQLKMMTVDLKGLPKNPYCVSLGIWIQFQNHHPSI